MEPAPVPPHVFAIDSESVRYGCFPRAGTGLESREYHDVELPPKAFGAGLIGCALQEERSFRQGLDDLLSRVAGTVTEASIVLPDSWLRIVLTETGDLPRSAHEREEILRWKLKQLVPFRVDDLRLQAVEVAPIPGSAENRRVMLGFGLDLLIGQLEAAFSAYGIRIGLVSNVTLSLLEAVEEATGNDEPKVVISAFPDGYALLLADSSMPLLYRFKMLDVSEASGEEVVRQLRLTRAFIDDHFPALRSGKTFVFARQAAEGAWKRWVDEGLGEAEVQFGSELLRWGGQPLDVEAYRVAPLLGAACAMVT